MRPWTDLIASDLPPEEAVQAAVAAGYADAPDRRWKLIHFVDPHPVRRIICACGALARKVESRHPVPLYEFAMRRQEIRIRAYGPFQLYLAQCPGCRTIYWDLWPA